MISETKTLRVLTYNIAFGRPEQLDGLTHALQGWAPHIATLNEADNERVVAELAHRLGYHYAWAKGSGERHVGTLSCFPILNWKIYNRKPLTQAALMTTLDYRPFGQQPLTVYNVHFRPDPFWHYELFRLLAANKLVSVIRRQTPGPHLIMGDLNTYAPGDAINLAAMLRYMAKADERRLRYQRYLFLRLTLRRLYWAGYTDCFRRLHPQLPGYTFTRKAIPVSRVDYILADRPMTQALATCFVVDCGPTAAVSDHLPLVAEFDCG